MLARISTVKEDRIPGWQGIDRPSPTVTATGAAKGSGRGATEVQILVEPWEDDEAVKLRAQRGGSLRAYDDVTDRPMTTVLAFQPTDVQLEPDAVIGPRRRGPKKPPYRVPTMEELRALNGHGRVVASTFSGAGGSCLGYRMAGFDVRCAVEIAAVPAQSYRENFPTSAVLEKSIRDVEPAEILEACGVGVGELDVFDGSPPCTSFSTAGLRSKTWGQVREHAGAQQRIDDLFFEYARLVEGLQPRTFVAENVAGLARGAAIGYFKAILRALRQCGYLVGAQLLDADMLGVPQNRERVIFVGVREDVAADVGLDLEGLHAEVFPKPLPYQYTVRDALPWLDPSSEAFSLQGTPFGTPERIAAGKATPPERVKDVGAAPAATIVAAGNGKAGVQIGTNKQGRGAGQDVDEPSPAIRSRSFESEGHDLSGTVTVRWDAQGGEGWPDPKEILDDVSPAITVGGDTARNSNHFMVETNEPPSKSKEWKLVETAEGGTVYRRKFTILEVKRLCSFPDDYVLTGKYAQQWAQLGNSVPPLLMRSVADGLRERIFGEPSPSPVATTRKRPRERYDG